MQPAQNPVAAASRGECRDEGAERRPEQVELGERGERRGGEHAEADHVREARRPGVLEPSLSEPRLDQLEVGDARQAPAAAEG